MAVPFRYTKAISLKNMEWEIGYVWFSMSKVSNRKLILIADQASFILCMRPKLQWKK